MGLLTVIRKVRRKQREIRLLMVGLDNAGVAATAHRTPHLIHHSTGKTTVVKFLSGDDISTVSPTLGFNIKTLHRNGYSVNIWDVGGQKTLRSYWRNYFEATDGLVWVVDSADKVRSDQPRLVQKQHQHHHCRLQDCKAELHALLKEERLAGATLLILANKQDIAGALPVDSIEQVLRYWLCVQAKCTHSNAQALDLKHLGNRHCKVQGCSPVQGTGVQEGFDWLVQDIGNRIYMLS